MSDENKKVLLNGEKIANLDARNQAWKKTRERGELSYILRDALIGCVSLCVVHAGYEGYYHHSTFWKFIVNSISPALEGLFVGSFAAVWEWSRNESRYQKAITQNFATDEFLVK
jgi:hypothetical protein